MRKSAQPLWPLLGIALILAVAGCQGSDQETIAALEARVAALETWARRDMNPWVSQAHIWMWAANAHIAWPDGTEHPDPPPDPPAQFGG